MPYSTTDPPTWPGPGYDQRGRYQQLRRAPTRRIQEGRAPRRQPDGPPPRGRRPIVIAVGALSSLLLVTIVGLLALRLHNTGFHGASTGIDTLSPNLASYMAQQGGNMGAAVYDVTHDRTYSYDADKTYILASSTKVYLMLADLDSIESRGQPPSTTDVQLLTAMIEHSDNDAAQAIYQQMGYDTGMQRYMKKLGITDYVPCADGWGCAQASAGDMVHALTLLDEGRVLTASDRQLALRLMHEVEANQRMGVGETAPSGAQVYMKDGWLNYPDPSVWNLNTAGIVVAGNETYIISVYAQNQPGEDWTKVDHVCALAAQTLG